MYPRIKRILLDLFGKPENPFFTKIKPLIKSELKSGSVNTIFYLGGSEYKEDLRERFVESINQEKLSEVLAANPYNVHSDDIELYYLEGSKNKVILLLDHQELYSNEEILDIVEARVNPNDFPESEIIYEAK